jgi:hypothetical protein
MTRPAVIVATSLLAFGSAAASAAKKPPPCSKPGSVTVFQNKTLRLYTVADSGNSEWVVCGKRTNRRRIMTYEVLDENDVLDFDVRGSYVALYTQSSGPDYTETDVVWTRAGLVSAPRALSADFDDPNPTGSAGVDSWALSPSGAVAIVGSYHDASRVIARTFAGKPQVLDTGPTGLGSLALARDDTLYWRHDGEVRSASLAR